MPIIIWSLSIPPRHLLAWSRLRHRFMTSPNSKLRLPRHCGIKQKCDSCDQRCNLLEELQPFTGHRWFHHNETSGIATRLSKASDESAAKRIGYECENDGNGAGLF